MILRSHAQTIKQVMVRTRRPYLLDTTGKGWWTNTQSQTKESQSTIILKIVILFCMTDELNWLTIQILIKITIFKMMALHGAPIFRVTDQSTY